MQAIHRDGHADRSAPLSAFGRRDENAVRALYREYGRLVYAVCYRVLGRRDLAEEATERTFLEAWQAADRIDAARDPSAWLATIASHAAIDIHRREARRPAVAFASAAEGQSAMSSAPPDPDSLDVVWLVRHAISALPPDEATVVRLQHVEGLTHAEIADRLGIELGTVKARSHRAHQRVLTLLGHLRVHTAAS